MNEDLILEVYKLKEVLENDPRVKDMLEAERIMKNDEDVMRLSYRFSIANDEYNEALRHFKIDSGEARNAQKKLYEAKLALDSNPLVSDYLKKYQQVRLMYSQIDEIVFAKFHNKAKCLNEKR